MVWTNMHGIVLLSLGGDQTRGMRLLLRRQAVRRHGAIKRVRLNTAK